MIRTGEVADMVGVLAVPLEQHERLAADENANHPRGSQGPKLGSSTPRTRGQRPWATQPGLLTA